MAQTTFTVRMDADTKRRFNELCNNIGLTMSAAIGIFAKKAVSERRIPLDLTANADPADPFFSPANQARLKKSIAEMEATGGTLHEVGEGDG